MSFDSSRQIEPVFELDHWIELLSRQALQLDALAWKRRPLYDLVVDSLLVQRLFCTRQHGPTVDFVEHRWSLRTTGDDNPVT
jgi:hypothetical protein